MASFESVLDGMAERPDGWGLVAPESWMQGRTLYGGLSAALALHACERLVADLPPLRSGQIAFIGPASGELLLKPTVLRQGRSVTFLGCDLLADGAVAMRALFAFGGARPSAHAGEACTHPAVDPPEACRPLWGGMRPAFTRQIDQRLAGALAPFGGADRGDLLVWARHEEPVRRGLVPLIALGDALPPASFTRFAAPAMISTMTWSFDLFAPVLSDGTGWLLLHSRDDGVGDGYAGQDMAMWDADGRPVMLGRQSVAIFA